MNTKISESIHIEVYILKKNKIDIGLEVEDLEKGVLFSTYLFPEALLNFEQLENNIIYFSKEDIKKRFEKFKHEMVQYPSVIDIKVDSIINFIHNNEKNYIGMKTIF